MAIKTSISFGLVYIPVSLHNAVKKNQISFNMLHKKYKSRISYKKTCPQCGDKEVLQKDIVKGYQYQDDKYVIIEDSDFEKIKSKRDKTITIELFCKIDAIDPVYYEKTYYVYPQAGAERAFGLLANIMEKSGKVGISQTVLGNKDTLVCLRVQKRNMMLTTLHFAQEVLPGQYSIPDTQPDERELKLAAAIMDNMTGEFDSSAYTDNYSEKLTRLIEDKINGKETVTADKGTLGGINILSLMDALERSLKGTKPAPAQKKKTATAKAAKQRA